MTPTGRHGGALDRLVGAGLKAAGKSRPLAHSAASATAAASTAQAQAKAPDLIKLWNETFHRR